jgi:vancomycin resistance protein VanW
MKLKKHSKIRIITGQLFYTAKRQVDWNLSGKKFARRKEKRKRFPVMVFHHESPLFRNLPKMERQLELNKVKNLSIAIQRINNIVIDSNEIFSLWLLLGRPTQSKGYLEGFVLDNGEVKPGIGGGLCQLANLIFWMTLHTPLTVIERWRHSHDVFPDANRTVPFGSGATCSYPSLDLQIKNTTQQPIQLCLELSDSHLIGEWRSLNLFEYSYQVYEAFHEMTCDFDGRYIRHNILRRRVLNDVKFQISDEFILENRALMMYQPLLSEKTIIHSNSI